MAKQTGIHGLRGKVNGMSYYNSKNGGDLVRKINEGMGARVKSAREYSNTRKNNAEFGAAGDFAGKFIGTISQRWRFILQSTAVGQIVKFFKEALTFDRTSQWGQRALTVNYIQPLFDKFNSLSKNDLPEVLVNAIENKMGYNMGSKTIELLDEVAVNDDLAQMLADIGASGFSLDVYTYDVLTPQFDPAAMKYSNALCSLMHIDSLSRNISNVAVDTQIFADGITISDVDLDISDSSEFGCLFVLFRPYRTIGGVANILQEHCAGWMGVPQFVSQP